MKARHILILILITGFAFSPAAWSAKNYPDIVTQLVTDTKLAIDTIDMESFRTIVGKRAYDMIIDVREPDEYDVGHVSGAINIPRGVIEFRIWRHVGYPDATDTAKRIYLYCKTGSRCALATHSLKQLGFTRVVAVDMRYPNWERAGYPVDFRVE